MKLASIVFSFFFIFPAIAHSSNWHTLEETEKWSIKIDRASIASAGGKLKKAWILMSYPETQFSKDYPPVAYKSIMQLTVFNCEERTEGTLQVILYSDEFRGGEIVKSRTGSIKHLDLSDVVPGSIGEDWLNYGCTWNVRGSKSKK